jgi:hypothetical protein
VVDGPRLGQVFETEGRWSVEQLDAALGPHFEGLRPIVDGFAIVPTG